MLINKTLILDQSDIFAAIRLLLREQHGIVPHTVCNFALEGKTIVVVLQQEEVDSKQPGFGEEKS